MKQQGLWCLSILLMLTSPVQGIEEERTSGSRILNDLRNLNFSEEKIENFFKSAEFLNDTQIVNNLLDELQQMNTVDEIYLVRMALRRMTCQPERLIIERINTEKIPQQKAKLLMTLMDFYGKDVLLIIVEQLGDTRKIDCESCGTRRICDVAYMTLIFQLEQYEFIQHREFEDIYGKEIAYRDQRIQTLKQYWESKKMFILETIPERKIPEYFQWRYKQNTQQQKPAQ